MFNGNTDSDAQYDDALNEIREDVDSQYEREVQMLPFRRRYGEAGEQFFQLVEDITKVGDIAQKWSETENGLGDAPTAKQARDRAAYQRQMQQIIQDNQVGPEALQLANEFSTYLPTYFEVQESGVTGPVHIGNGMVAMSSGADGGARIIDKQGHVVMKPDYSQTPRSIGTSSFRLLNLLKTDRSALGSDPEAFQKQEQRDITILRSVYATLANPDTPEIARRVNLDMLKRALTMAPELKPLMQQAEVEYLDIAHTTNINNKTYELTFKGTGESGEQRINTEKPKSTQQILAEVGLQSLPEVAKMQRDYQSYMTALEGQDRPGLQTLSSAQRKDRLGMRLIPHIVAREGNQRLIETSKFERSSARFQRLRGYETPSVGGRYDRRMAAYMSTAPSNDVSDAHRTSINKEQMLAQAKEKARLRQQSLEQQQQRKQSLGGQGS